VNRNNDLLGNNSCATLDYNQEETLFGDSRCCRFTVM
jgi:hypothetical protein